MRTQYCGAVTGADIGNIFRRAGIQVPPGDAKAFQAFLDRLGYEYADETENPAYKLFLK